MVEFGPELETCGNCLEFRIVAGVGRCKLRHLQVDAPDAACEFLKLRGPAHKGSAEYV